jgi:hypothetical protein
LTEYEKPPKVTPMPMKDEFNDNADPRAHHYILRLSRHAGVNRLENPEDEIKPPFQQAVLFLERLQNWAAASGKTGELKGEVLPVTEDGRPRLRLACPPAMLEDIQNVFGQKIRAVDEIPLPKPKGKKPAWLRFFGF